MGWPWAGLCPLGSAGPPALAQGSSQICDCDWCRSSHLLFRGLLATGLVFPSLSWGVQAPSCPATCLVCFPLPELEGYLPTWWNILTFLFHSFCLLSFSLKETVSPN